MGKPAIFEVALRRPDGVYFPGQVVHGLLTIEVGEPLKLTCKFLLTRLYHLSLVVRKPVFGVFDLVPHKPGCTATEDG